MTISFNDIVAFVKRAMKENLDVTTCLFSNSIDITNKDDKVVSINVSNKIWGDESQGKVINVTINGKTFFFDITEREHLEFELLKKDVEEYSTGKAIYEFSNFFDRDCFKYKDINSLDDEEEED